VTGASGGVGAGIARRLGEAGAPRSSSTTDPTRMVPRPWSMTMGAAGSRAIAASAELLDRAALLSEPTSFQRYGIGSLQGQGTFEGTGATGTYALRITFAP
jgi:hypothetical protein